MFTHKFQYYIESKKVKDLIRKKMWSSFLVWQESICDPENKSDNRVRSRNDRSDGISRLGCQTSFEEYLHVLS